MKLPKASKSNKTQSSAQGLTAIEVLTAIGIVAVIFSLGLILGIDFYRSYAMNSERDVLISSLMKARSRAANNINQSAHGVYLTADKIVIFQGSSYSGRNALYDQDIKLSESVSKSGLNETVFQQLTAESSASGTIILSNSQRTINISVNNEGKIDY